MCLGPEVLIPMALSGTGEYLSARENANNEKRVQRAKNDVYNQNMERQRAFADEAGQQMSDLTAQSGRDNFDVQKGSEADRFKQAFASIKTEPDYNTGFVASTPKNVVVARENARKERATDKTERDLEGISNLTGYSGALFNQNLDQSQFARMFGNVQDKASADNRLLPIELQAAANNARKGPSLFPTLLKTAGQGMMLYNVANPGAALFTPGQGGVVSQTVDPLDYLSSGARKDIAYAQGGGYGPYRY